MLTWLPYREGRKTGNPTALTKSSDLKIFGLCNGVVLEVIIFVFQAGREYHSSKQVEEDTTE
jgi:hypothetical protein